MLPGSVYPYGHLTWYYVLYGINAGGWLDLPARAARQSGRLLPSLAARRESRNRAVKEIAGDS